MALPEHLLHMRALHGPEDDVGVDVLFLVHEQLAQVGGLGPVGEGGFGSFVVVGGGGGGGGVGFAVGGDVVEVDVLAVGVLGGGFRGGGGEGEFVGVVRGFVEGLLLLLLLGGWVVGVVSGGIRSVGEGDFGGGELLHVGVVAGAWHLLWVRVLLLVGLVLGG